MYQSTLYVFMEEQHRWIRLQNPVRYLKWPPCSNTIKRKSHRDISSRFMCSEDAPLLLWRFLLLQSQRTWAFEQIRPSHSRPSTIKRWYHQVFFISRRKQLGQVLTSETPCRWVRFLSNRQVSRIWTWCKKLQWTSGVCWSGNVWCTCTGRLKTRHAAIFIPWFYTESQFQRVDESRWCYTARSRDGGGLLHAWLALKGWVEADPSCKMRCLPTNMLVKGESNMEQARMLNNNNNNNRPCVCSPCLGPRHNTVPMFLFPSG